MEIKITSKLKKIISTLVCVMMVFGTFPVHMLNSSVFAEDAGVYGAQTAAIPEIAEDIEGENANSDESNGQQVVEPEKEAEDVLMEGGGGYVEVKNLRSLQAAITNAKPEEQTVIALTNDISITNRGFSSVYSLECEEKSITITSADPNNKRTIKIESTKFGLLKAKNSNVRFENINIMGTVALSSDGVIKNAIYEQSAINAEGGSITVGRGTEISQFARKNYENKGNFIYCSEGTVNVEGGEIKCCDAKDGALGGFVFCSRGTVNITGGSFYQCRARYGGVIFSDGATVNISGGSFDTCLAEISGGFIYSKQGGEINISGGNFERGNNVGVYCSESTFTMTGGKITGCGNEFTCGAAIRLVASSFTMKGGEISDCKAWDGGAIFADESSKIYLEKGKITGCSATGTGNAIRVDCNTTLALKEFGKGLTIEVQGKGLDSPSSETAGYKGIYINRGAKYGKEEVLSGSSTNNSVSSSDYSFDGNNSNQNNNYSKTESKEAGESSNASTEASKSENEANANDANNKNEDIKSDNDLDKNSNLQKFLSADPDSNIVQIDSKSGIVLTAKDGIIPAGYHFVVEKLEKGSDEWANRTKDLDEDKLAKVKKIGIYDFALKNSSGDVFNLPGKNNVTVTIFMPCLEGWDKDDLQAIHISTGIDEDFTEEIVDVSGQDYCKFKTTHFSPYALINEISKNDFWESMIPWLIGAAVVAIGAAVVVVVFVKKKNGI